MDSFLSLFDPNQPDDGFDEEQDLQNGNLTASSNSQSGSGSEGEQDVHCNKIVIDFDQEQLPPEPQLGNIEYKLKLINPSKQRFEHLVTQMKWRLREGHGEAIYEIGVSDAGHLHGLNEKDMNASLVTLKQMAHKLGASTSVLRKKFVAGRRSVAEVLVRKIPDDQHNIEVRVAVLGGADAGKSTLLGVLTQGEFDNGRGRARLNMFRHMHEIQSGRTSCISHETLGFDAQGNIINYKYNEMMTAEEISDRSTKLVTFMDLAGHRRYIRTTVQALSGYSPHYAMLVVSAGSGFNSTSKEHLSIARALDMPFFIVITKTDITSPDQTIQDLKNLLTSIGCRKVPFVITNADEVISAGSNQVSGSNIVPIFCVSNVTGAGLNLVTKFLYVLSPGISNAEKERLEQEPCEFHIDEIFRVSEVGTVVGGLLVKGVLTENMPMKIGPLPDGYFHSVTVHTIHRNKAPCRVVRAGQSASLSFTPNQTLPQIRSGMVLLTDSGNPEVEPRGTIFFQAKVSVLFHATAIFVGFQTTVHIGSIRQTAVIRGIMGCGKIGTNDKASVLFQFVGHPEYVRPGMRILFREGTSKGIGFVTQVFPLIDPVT
ncbi:GTP-binding protein 2 [Teleopsis dalmanni]|uniref:GTP-binding protein 2 n=1 Tax=Teleopsis dalmanni TaxID=139649 RepID=UPI0018CE087D|nr:GTP-binding protein 2 [Teleopsis dalmanni]XP_037956927.1 GTP-binding protein 2 [Teleopsis dalmanni]XP_037956928.1 GTP-binding protein 2 [Teleopsis dalmanni]